jgi:hypothetical protein
MAVDVRRGDAEAGQHRAQRSLEAIEVVTGARDFEVAAVDLQAERKRRANRELFGIPLVGCLTPSAGRARPRLSWRR